VDAHGNFKTGCVLFAHALSGTTVRVFVLIVSSMKSTPSRVLRTSRALPLAVLPLALTAAFSTFAQTAAPSLPDVVVTASRTEQRVQDALPATTLLTRADIERSQSSDLVGLLRSQTGIELTQSGSAGTVASAFIRGAESRHTLVLVDGVAVNNLSFSTAALEHLPLSNIERIEIVRGNVSSLYGSAAIGGVIQIFTREAADKPFAALTLQAGSRGLVQMQTGAGVKLGSGTRLSFTTDNLYDGGFNAIDQVKQFGTNPDVDAYTRNAWSAGISQDFAIGKIGLTVRQSAGVTAYDSEFGPATQADESKFSLQGAALVGQFNLGPTLAVDVAASNTVDKLQADVTAFPYFVNSFSNGTSIGARWQLAKGQTVTGGFESTRQRIESDTIYNASERQQNSARLGYQADFEQHQLQINLRQDRYSDFGAASTWYAGYAYRLSSAWRINASASTGFTAPTFNDLYYPFGGNPDLRPEQVNSSELGLQYATASQTFRAVVFSNRFRDLIGNDAFFNRVNIDQAQNDGLEFSYQAKYGATGVRAGLTSQNPVDVATGKRLNRRAATVGHIGFTHDAGPWAWGANIRFSGERPDGSNTLAAYSVVDLTASRVLTPDMKLLARIDNLMDSRYETAYGYNQARQAAFVGVTWQPKF
jgi:vitamin B12 transporter